MGRMERLREKLFTRKAKNTMKIPTAWLSPQVLSPQVGLVPEKQQETKVEVTPTSTVQVPTGFVVVEKDRVPRKIHIPQLRTTKRLIVAFLLVFNFIFAQGMIGAGNFSTIMYIFFMANVVMFIDYLRIKQRRSSY